MSAAFLTVFAAALGAMVVYALPEYLNARATMQPHPASHALDEMRTVTATQWAAAAAVIAASTYVGAILQSSRPWFVFAAAILSVCALIDLRCRILPDVLVVLLAGVGIVGAWQSGDAVIAATGAALGFGIGYSVAWVSKKLTGQDGFGLGDVKLLAAIGVWVGPLLVAPVLGVAVMVAAVVLMVSRGSEKTLPLGPYLGAATLSIVWIAG